MTNHEYRYEWMRPHQLIAERKRCPLVFLPVGPLEYHGPHMPMGTDAINATWVAGEACRLLGKGVVHPTLFMGTERERADWELRSLGFSPGEWIVGMDFPSCQWKSHYYQEQVFALILASTLELLIDHAYCVIVIVNGHGALNHRATIDRLAAHYSHTTESVVRGFLAFPQELFKGNQVGHADRFETSMLLYYQGSGADMTLVDLSRLPDRGTPLHYQDYSIVDAEGFTVNPSPGWIVQADPREADIELGKNMANNTVGELVELVEGILASNNL
ncbi:MAG: creatininase family protein [Spirochaetaceae bacterium]|nr:MAG: creatininase family protein [Spirochaetaceae bacterium]